MPVLIRRANSADVEAVTQLFRETVKRVNSPDYSSIQIDHWVSGADDIPKWEKRIEDWFFLVAVENNVVVGFAYLNRGNYFDGLFVHHQHQGKGIATALADEVENKARVDGYSTIHSDVSITAKPFFEKRGYKIEFLQEKPYRGMIFHNYIVSKTLQPI